MEPLKNQPAIRLECLNWAKSKVKT